MSPRPLEVLITHGDRPEGRRISELLDGDPRFQVTAVASHREATDLLENGEPETVLVNLTPDDASGFDTLAEVRRRYPDTSVLMLSESDEPVEALRSAEAGAQAYLVTTGLDLDGLAAQIRDALVRQQVLAETVRQLERARHGFETQLEQLTQLTSSVAGELNNHLVGVLGNAELANADLADLGLGTSDVVEALDASPLGERIDLLVEAAGQASDLTQELLTYAGSSKVAVEPLDISLLLEEAAPILEVAVGPSVELRFNLGRNLPLLESDPAEIRRLAITLLQHAAIAGGSPITLSTGVTQCGREDLGTIYGGDGMRTGTFLYLDVADGSPGLEDDVLETTYDALLDHTEGPLGAVMVTLRRFYGGLRVSSNPDTGVACRILLPAFERSADGEIPLSRGWHDGGAVLLVDPRSIVRRTAAPTLERIGFEPLLAADVDEALAAFDSATAPVVLALIDADLPAPGSEALFRELHQRAPEVPLVATSGRGEDEVFPRFEPLGAAEFLRKPFRIVNLKRIIRRILHESSPQSGAQDVDPQHRDGGDQDQDS